MASAAGEEQKFPVDAGCELDVAASRPRAQEDAQRQITTGIDERELGRTGNLLEQPDKPIEFALAASPVGHRSRLTIAPTAIGRAVVRAAGIGTRKRVA